MNRSLLAAGISALLMAMPQGAQAQQAGVSGPPVAASPGKPLPTVTLDLKDASLRAALQQIFESARVQYILDNRVSGYVTLKIIDQPFENALKLILRGASLPVRYSVENSVYVVEPRPTDTGTSGPELAPPPARIAESAAPNGHHLETFTLTYADPYDLAGVLGITILPVGSRGDGILGGANGALGTGGFGGANGRGGAASGAGVAGGSNGGVTTGARGNTPLGGTNGAGNGRGSFLGNGSGGSGFGPLLNNGNDNTIISID